MTKEYIPPSNIYDPFAPTPARAWVQLTNDGEPIPAWVKARQIQAANALAFVAPKPTKAKPLDHTQIKDALAEHFHVYETRELVGLDVWFIKTISLTPSRVYEMILYEHRGDWHCLCVRERTDK